MMALTHTVLAVGGCALLLGTAQPLPLAIAAVASQLPDMDTSKSIVGRVLFPISRYLEQRFPHRTLTHSFLFTALIAGISLPFSWLIPGFWSAMTIGYFWGWFADAFTKTGVAAFWPSRTRFVIPGNPRLRLSTGSSAEWFLLIFLIALTTGVIHMNLQGGIMRAFTNTLGNVSGAVETYRQEGAKHQVTAHVQGYDRLTQQPIEGDFEVVQVVASDLLIRQGQRFYRAGTTVNSNIQVARVFLTVGKPITLKVQEIALTGQPLKTVLSQIRSPKTYLTGSLELEAEGLILNQSEKEFSPVTLRYLGGSRVLLQLESCPPEQLQPLAEFFVNGNLIIREIR